MDHRRELIEFPEIYRKSREEFRVNKLGCRERSALLGGKGRGSPKTWRTFCIPRNRTPLCGFLDIFQSFKLALYQCYQRCKHFSKLQARTPYRWCGCIGRHYCKLTQFETFLYPSRIKKSYGKQIEPSYIAARSSNWARLHRSDDE